MASVTLQLLEPRTFDFSVGYSVGGTYVVPLAQKIDVTRFGSADILLRLHDGTLATGNGCVQLLLTEAAPTAQDPRATFQGAVVGVAGLEALTAPGLATGMANFRTAAVAAYLVFVQPSVGQAFDLGVLTISADLVLKDSRVQWTPAQLGSKLRLWTDHRDQTIVSGAVSTWGDESGNADNFTQGTAANRPAPGLLNRWAALVFNGTNSHMGAPNPVLSVSGYHVFAVVTPTGAFAAPGANLYNDPLIFGDTQTYYGMIVNTSGLTVWHYQGGYINTPHLPIMSNHRYLVEWSYDGAKIRCRLNAGAISTVSAGNVAVVSNPPQLGQGFATGGFFHGTIASVIVSNAFLTSNEAGSVRAYLSSKYGVPV